MFIFVIGGNFSGELNFFWGGKKRLLGDSAYVFRRNESSAVLTTCIGYIPTHLLCSFYMWQKRRERMKHGWKRPLFLFPLKADIFSSPHPVLSWGRPHFKSWPGPVCHVTCLPKGLFQINSSSPWEACPPFLTESPSEKPSAHRRHTSKKTHCFKSWYYFIISYKCRRIWWKNVFLKWENVKCSN